MRLVFEAIMQTHARRVFRHENSADYIGALADLKKKKEKKIIINGARVTIKWNNASAPHRETRDSIRDSFRDS